MDIRFRRAAGAFDLALSATLPVGRGAVGLLGRSGSGKTTLLHLLAGLEHADDGRIVLGDRVLYDKRRGTRVPPHRRRIGVVFQDTRLFPHMSVRGNLRYGLPRRGEGFDFDEVVDLLELGPHLARRPTALSGGERQRVAIGRAVLSRPDLLLLDEPLAALDPRLKRQILPLVERVRDVLGVPLIFVSHDVAEVLRVSDRLLLLEAGRVAGEGRLPDLVEQRGALDLLHHGLGLVSVLRTVVQSHDPAEGRSRLALGDASATTLDAPLAAEPPGGSVSVAIRAEDVAIAPEPVRAVSIRNQLPANVVRLTEHRGSAILLADVGQPLLAEVSLQAARAFGLSVGQRIWCLVKSNAIRHLPG